VIAPEGDSVRKALKWIAQSRAAEPSLPLKELIDRASAKFDLSPIEEEALFTWVASSRGGSERLPGT
jgi:hypothetical protein